LRAYVDSSVVLRVALGEPARLAAWTKIREPVTSELARVECFRVIDRQRLGGLLEDDEVADRRDAIDDLLSSFEIAALDRRILRRATEPMPTSLRTLDAIHIASALAVRGRDPTLRLATHDAQMATAARALGFRLLA
jgi:predicted nucleic acid-binding protein